MKRKIRLFVGGDGILTVEDPSPLEIKVLNRLGIKLEENKPSDLSDKLSPNYRLLRDYRIKAGLPQNPGGLLNLHNREIKNALQGKNTKSGHLSIFALKRKLFKIYLKRCYLCGHGCKGQRILSGECPMGRPSYYYQHFIHLGEEKEIGRTLVVELIGCNIRCRFCQKGELINPEKADVAPFTPSLWRDIEREYHRDEFDNISFLGGNPDQSFLAVLDFLENAPDWASHLPIVWHTNGYSTPIFYSLLYGLVDVLVFDFKYFNSSCALSLSQAPQYKETAKSALRSIYSKKLFPLVIVRNLVLPGHWGCCQRPLLEYLKEFKDSMIFHPVWYRPSWEVTEEDGKLCRPTSEEEFIEVKNYASALKHNALHF